MKLGDKMRFVPSAFTCFNDGSPIQAHCGSPTEVTGTVDYINEEHRWYRVSFKVFGTILHEGFKF